jgi:hypothetical protein
MSVWRRREPDPDTPLTEARKELVHSYMDAEESESRRRAVERFELQSRLREQARTAAAGDATRQAATTPTHAVEDTRRDDDAYPEDDVARLVAAAAAAAREEGRREADEETAKQVAVAVEQALREAKEETVRQLAEAVARARNEAAETATRRGAVPAEPTPEPVREPELSEPTAPLASEADTEPTAEQPAEQSSIEGLPLSERIEAATRPDEATARVDWTRELVRRKQKARIS